MSGSLKCRLLKCRGRSTIGRSNVGRSNVGIAQVSVAQMSVAQMSGRSSVGAQTSVNRAIGICSETGPVSDLNYGIVIYGGTTTTNILRLTQLQCQKRLAMTDAMRGTS
ncbi:unnamed protein product [Didymodactylos carnosus]|uniref:Uncharacterized protein n=1 Tax=Didymodactylos carnosus TaxID=1234261 RepID=A0A814Q2I0_9BILA|nr:unnamed protein product [Didymodactylos carnosus]CAF3878477.1 unnamed protein product [Didymodactylos carnosus]